MATTTIDLSADTTLNLTLRAATTMTLLVTVTQGDEAVDITSATIKYQADLSTPVTKTVGSGITITNAAAGQFTIQFLAADTSSQNSAQQVDHECKVTVGSYGPAVLFEGKLTLEKSVFTTMT